MLQRSLPMKSAHKMNEEKPMSKLFQATTMMGMKLANRFVRSATWEGLAADDGTCTPELKALYVELAKGGVGLIITSHTYVRRDGMGSPRQLGLSDDTFIPGLRELTDAIHRHNGRVAVELSHAGILSNPKVTGLTPLVLSKVDGYAGSEGRVMTVEDIQAMIEAFGQAARRAKEAGFDAIQIHGAHGFLVNQFLSPAFNKRTDAYGGPIANRTRAVLEILAKMKSYVGNDFPILIKMNSEDVMEGGLTVDDSLQAARMLQDAGIGAIELSGGTVVTGDHCRKDIDSEEKEAYWRKAAKVFKERLAVPLILVGGVRSLQLAEKLYAEGYADYFSMSRPFIREPGLVARWAAGDWRKATCSSDNLCRGPLMAGGGIYCVVEKQQEQKK
jgi:2,4-dienoyl-CoA reductase-like NADH-dependent reductase (Old Yellow Enzyme family)